jgi:hypothetical protein
MPATEATNRRSHLPPDVVVIDSHCRKSQPPVTFVCLFLWCSPFTPETSERIPALQLRRFERTPVKRSAHVEPSVAWNRIRTTDIGRNRQMVATNRSPCIVTAPRKKVLLFYRKKTR